MKKLFIASDIHGSSKYCRLMLEAFERSGAQKLLLLGDLLYHGARNDLPDGYEVKQVFAMLNKYKDRILAVRGNCDSEVDQMVLDFPIMAEYAVLTLEAPAEADPEKAGDDEKAASGDATDERIITVFAHHGHHFDENHPMPLGMGEIMLCGHTHVPKDADHGSFVYLNPGSVSIPKGVSRHSYMIYEDGVFSWHDLLTGEKYHEFRP
ncbi:MAG: phosphodiesterase [Firmicutes bacterium]|nr:phosphodiesterase [Bacillota bacterium]